MSGISLRSAISLGLNLRVAHSTISDIPSEIRIGVWWSLWTLGQTLNLMTDRNAEVDLSICNIPLPRPLFEGGFDGGNHRQVSPLTTGAAPTESKIPPANDSHLYYQYIQLFLISHDVTKSLHMLDSRDVEESVSALWRLTERWLHQLPHEYNFGQSAMPVRSDAMT
ncbi:fungal specific transcription factor domain-containing protein variant 1 [Penicillium chrysogenum]|nr:fungal specific transcription factor domain-containing protein variant 1 [Penicillium chrysogenum]